MGRCREQLFKIIPRTKRDRLLLHGDKLVGFAAEAIPERSAAAAPSAEPDDDEDEEDLEDDEEDGDGSPLASGRSKGSERRSEMI